MLLRNSLLTMAVLILTSCATINSPMHLSNPLPRSVTKLSAWHVQGKFAIRTATGADSASFDWTQRGDQYTLALFGPLGLGAYTLTGNSTKVTLTTPNGARLHASSPENLLAKTTGWRLPVTNLKYWIRGLNVPSSEWHPQFRDYKSFQQLEMPTKILLTSPRLTIKIVISKWDF